MPELSEIKEKYPRVDRPKYLWSIGYFDGPLNGVCEYANHKHYFEMIDEIWEQLSDDSDDNDSSVDQIGLENSDSADNLFYMRYFVIRELSPEELAKLEANHDLFQKHVGNNSTYFYDETGKPISVERELNPREEWSLFYDAPKEKVHPNGKIVAWYRC